MKFITNEIKTLLKTLDYGIDVQVVRSFNESLKTFPRIVISEITNKDGMRTSTDRQAIGLLAFQFDIFSQDDVINDAVMSRINVADSIASVIDTAIVSTYGMTRDEYVSDTSYAEDTCRAILRYSCKIDASDYTYPTN